MSTSAKPTGSCLEKYLEKQVRYEIGERYLSGKFYSSTGVGDPVRFLCLHGWLDNANSFDKLVPEIFDCFLNANRKFETDFGVQVLALDFAGHGLSEHLPPQSDYLLSAYTRDVYFLIKNLLKWETFNLIGHSMGGAVSTLVSSAFPEMVENLFLVENLGPISKPYEHTSSSLRHHILRRINLPNRPKPVYKSIEQAIEARKNGTSNGTISYEGAKLLTMRGITPIGEDGAVTWVTDQQLVTSNSISYSEPQVLDLLSHIECPVVLITGKQGFEVVEMRDLDLHWIDWQKRWKSIKSSEKRKVSLDGGHHLHLDQRGSKEIARVIVDSVLDKQAFEKKSNL